VAENAFASIAGGTGPATAVQDFMMGLASATGSSLLLGQPPVDGLSNALCGFEQGRLAREAED